MSGAGENRSSWQRPQGRGNRTSGSNNQNKDGGRQQSVSSVSGNAWKGKSAGGAQAQAPSVPTEQHVPVKDFNAGEVKDFLKKNQPSAYHKVQGDSVAKRSSGAWGSRGNMPHLMPSGQNFFTQLKKQLATLEQGKS
ncbi:hypothetical protein BU23DRAFT_579736 [Bimuria novae-zelandiae CBS 107.79]|uniref:Uncharacterized protein n=1 Tax=Bimuria novae-zelandiae CBS 107.79 TaxID=1447943 RepID=A0A6A5VAR6_9PLEO|nr:hypothetical protein BU23DRAFT_579736 [Bimuria novae-zelandiae CBS 107.79]